MFYLFFYDLRGCEKRYQIIYHHHRVVRIHLPEIWVPHFTIVWPISAFRKIYTRTDISNFTMDAELPEML